jgi:hypothetical protein
VISRIGITYSASAPGVPVTGTAIAGIGSGSTYGVSASVHGLGEQLVPAPCQVPPAAAQATSLAWVQSPLGRQHAPSAGGT